MGAASELPGRTAGVHACRDKQAACDWQSVVCLIPIHYDTMQTSGWVRFSTSDPSQSDSTMQATGPWICKSMKYMSACKGINKFDVTTALLTLPYTHAHTPPPCD